jgi:hypothetical protein
MGKRTDAQAARPGPAGSGTSPAMCSRQDGCCDGNPGEDHDTSLDAYVARLVDEAPPLTSEQRDTLTLLLRRASGRPPGAGMPGPIP